MIVAVICKEICGKPQLILLDFHRWALNVNTFKNEKKTKNTSVIM